MDVKIWSEGRGDPLKNRHVHLFSDSFVGLVLGVV